MLNCFKKLKQKKKAINLVNYNLNLHIRTLESLSAFSFFFFIQITSLHY